jgi:hypothetical protein
MERRHRVRRAVTRIVTDESLDLYILAATALAFTVLGVTGVSNIADLASIILALLAFLALSQIRSRRNVAAIARAQRADPLSVFSTAFPADLSERRAAAADLMLIGMTLSRTAQGAPRDDMRRILLRGGRIRALVLNPSNGELVTQAAFHHGGSLAPERLKARILSTLDEFTSLRDSTGGQIEIRVASFALTAGINAIDAKNPGGVLVVQHYEHRPPEEAAPIICLRANDGFWFSHYLAEAERMWQDATPWPLDPARALAYTARPTFLESFGPDLERSIDRARDLLITGVARNTFLNSNYGKFEARLRDGCRIRFLLTDPSSDHAVSSAADRYYVERSPEIVRERINHTLRLLDQLRRSSGGDLTVRLTAHPLAIGIIAADSTPDLRSTTSAIFAEYYTYQTLGEPKFILQPAEDQWYDDILGEAEALWAGACDRPQPAIPDSSNSGSTT